ncbi:hypothetical protein FNW52_19460 [Flavobacterium sp. ZT3R18]|uniref:hypothetical protein n=1 Tax=Flavobacterium sp. ZT3R18 TaxID=2594429 RepID=UPI001179BDB4|nr:hypothetical protein [Flavobacterium sp. ZT3R18]TRX30893.1 hypothetical protein FNW52_19460 [Flavobacterium sp. ZT3R18]
METNEIKNLEDIRESSVRYFKTLKPVTNKTDMYTAEIRVSDYCELAYVISNMLKLCILALDQEAPEISNTVKNTSINVGVVLEIVAQLLPLDEIEFLDEMHQMLIIDPQDVNKLTTEKE